MTVVVEVLAAEGDPQGDAAVRAAQEVVERLRVGSEVLLVPIADAELAARLGMRGSPTVRVGGRDIEPNPPAPGLGVRTWRDGDAREPTPPVWMLEAALIGALGPRRVLVLSPSGAGAAVASAVGSATGQNSARFIPARLQDEGPLPEAALDVLAEVGLTGAAPSALEDVDRGLIEAVIALGGAEIPEALRMATRCAVRWSLAEPEGEATAAAWRGLRDALTRRLRVLDGARGANARPRALGGEIDIDEEGAAGEPLEVKLASRLATLRVRQVYARRAADSAAAALEHDEIERACADLEASADEDEIELPDERLRRAYRLNDAEVEVLWVLLAASLQEIGPGPGFGAARAWTVAQVSSSLSRGTSVAAAVALLAPDARLARSGLVELGPGTDLFGREVTLASHAAVFLSSGRRSLGGSLGRVGALVSPRWGVEDVDVPRLYRELVLPLATRFFDAPPAPEEDGGPGGIWTPRGAAVALRGASGSGRTFALRAVAGSLGRGLLAVDGEALAQLGRAEGWRALEGAFAEAECFGELLVLRYGDALLQDAGLRTALRRGVERRRALVFLCIDTISQAAEALNDAVWLDLTHPRFTAPLDQLWRFNLPLWGREPEDAELAPLARYATLSPAQIRNAARLASFVDGVVPDAAEYAARAQLQGGFGQLASSESGGTRFNDLILPPETADQVQEIIAAVANRQRVLQQWRLRERLRRGLAITCLFDGDPGTGKTLAAEVIASEVGLRLMRVNISSIVDKYIGETEKNLTRLFERARPDLHLLMFDEADSLFSKRSAKIERSTDRYSNMDINVLLQLIERFEGVAVLTTNLKSGIDPAFERRISFKIHFPMPGPKEREKIWRRLFPEGFVPTAGAIDFAYLATFELAGGGIKNVVLRAAYRAARLGRRLNTDLLVEATIEEVRAAGHLVRDEDLYR